MAAYVIVSLKTDKVVCADNTEQPLVWRTIPRDHGDLTIRRHRPGSFAKHPQADVIFILPEGKLDPWEPQT